MDFIEPIPRVWVYGTWSEELLLPADCKGPILQLGLISLLNLCEGKSSLHRHYSYLHYKEECDSQNGKKIVKDPDSKIFCLAICN